MKKGTKRRFHPESLMMTHGYNPFLSEGAVVPPIFLTSTWAFPNAEAGERLFKNLQESDLVYSRMNNPNLQIFEEGLALWDEAEDCAVFASGMAAIRAVFETFLDPSDVLLYCEPVYGGTDTVLKNILPRKFCVETVGFIPQSTHKDIENILAQSDRESRLGMIFIETPTNPTIEHVDMELCARIAHEYSTPDHRVVLVVDNTFLPIY